MVDENMMATEQLPEKLSKEIEAKVAELKEAKKLKRVYGLYVFGDEEDDKEVYVGYFRQPSYSVFNAHMSLSQKDQIGALRQLARDCFLDGDKELIEDDSLFTFGLMPHISQLIQLRKGGMVNFSKSGK